MNHFDPDMDLHDEPDHGREQPTELPLNDDRRRIGRFVIDYLIGRGGMGEVYKAHDPVNDRVVALKVLNVNGYDDPDTLKRFERESEAALTLDHVNIARFYGTEKDDQGRPVIVMEYIDGRSLGSLAIDYPEMPFSQMLDYIIQTARGLENAVRRSIIHRDIKPDNLIIDQDNLVRIIDFGLAKSMWDNSNLTGSGLVVGTPRYISPEQGMGRNVDHRSDIYSLGATLYELVTGRTPFDGDTPLAIMMKHINAPLVPPYLVNPRVPADIAEIIMKMMAKDPLARYQDYEPLIRDLETSKIQRLAKERRTPSDLSAMQTVSLPEGTQETVYGTGTGSYLTEGLVSVDTTPREEPPASFARVILLSIAGLAVLGFTGLFLMKPVTTESGERSTLGQNIGAMFSNAKKRLDNSPSQADIAAKDREKIELTRARMDAVVNRLLKRGNRSIPTITSLRNDGTMTVEQTQDAWGNDFFITDSTGGGTLVAPGRDGHDNTADDFRLSLDGSVQVIPPALKPGADQQQ